MARYGERYDTSSSSDGKIMKTIGIAIGTVFGLIMFGWFCYTECRIEVGGTSMAILYHKTGKDTVNNEVVAPSVEYKGVQINVLQGGRYFYNPYCWDWEVVPQIEIPEGKIGVRIRLYGEDLPPGELIAWKENQKGIVPGVLNPGRYAINAKLAGAENNRYYDSYAEIIELHDPATVPAGYQGVLTELSAPMGKANELLAEKGKRGTQATTLEAGTYYLNPYVNDVNLIDCRSQRYNLTGENEVGFPSKDGFWVTLDGIIEFRVNVKEASRVYIMYHEAIKSNSEIDDEIVQKVILPNARSYARLRGSNYLGREFISGERVGGSAAIPGTAAVAATDTTAAVAATPGTPAVEATVLAGRQKFQDDFQKHLKETCATEGVEIIQALITRINPPQKIAEPVRQRQIAILQAQQYEKEMAQQIAEQSLATQMATVEQKREVVGAETDVVKITTKAKQDQEVAVIAAQQRLAVAEQELKAAQDLAAAIMSKGKAEADVITFKNQAEAAGWERSVKAFGGDGNEFARYTLLKKLAPSFKGMMVNTSNSPIMDIFSEYSKKNPVAPVAPVAPAPAPVAQ